MNFIESKKEPISSVLSGDVLNWRFWTNGVITKFSDSISETLVKHFTKAMNHYFHRNWSSESILTKETVYFKGIVTQFYKSGTVENIRCCGHSSRKDDIKYLQDGVCKYGKIESLFQFNLENSIHHIAFIRNWTASGNELSPLINEGNQANNQKVMDYFGLPLLELSSYAIIPIDSILNRIRMFPLFDLDKDIIENTTCCFPGILYCMVSEYKAEPIVESKFVNQVYRVCKKKHYERIIEEIKKIEPVGESSEELEEVDNNPFLESLSYASDEEEGEIEDGE